MIYKVHLRRYTSCSERRRTVIVDASSEQEAIEETMDTLHRPDFYVVERVEPVNPAEE